MNQFKSIPAKELWRKMLTMLFETGHPWITFKDSCNLRSPQQHAGVIHSSNLCTEITLNTSADNEIAVCNLGSVNLANHMLDGKLDEEKVKELKDMLPGKKQAMYNEDLGAKPQPKREVDNARKLFVDAAKAQEKSGAFNLEDILSGGEMVE